MSHHTVTAIFFIFVYFYSYVFLSLNNYKNLFLDIIISILNNQVKQCKVDYFTTTKWHLICLNLLAGF